MNADLIYRGVDYDGDFVKFERAEFARRPEAVYVIASMDGAYLTAEQVDELIAALRPYGGTATTVTDDGDDVLDPELSYPLPVLVAEKEPPLDPARVAALEKAKELLDEGTGLSDVLTLARFILGEELPPARPVPAPYFPLSPSTSPTLPQVTW